MKPILFMVLLGLSALAYASEPAPDDAGAVKATASPPASPVEDSDFLTAPADAPSCQAACAERYHFCLSASEDAVSDCACFDASVSCEAACGVEGGALVQC